MVKVRRFFVLLMCVFACFSSGCADGDRNKDNGGEDEVYNPSLNKEYFVEDIVKDGPFDTQSLFGEKTVYEEVPLDCLPSGITAIRFESAPYAAKNLDATKPFAAFAVPKSEMPKGGYPAIVLVHGGGGQVYTEWIKYWASKGYVAIALDMFGNMLDSNGNKTPSPLGGPDESKSGSINDSAVGDITDSWVYHSVVNVIRCNNILRSMDCVNPNKIGVTGISWGGFVTMIVSGVDKRFAAFAPVYSSGFIYDDSVWVGAFGGENRDEWIARYDPSSYLPYATKPMLFVSGVDDNCFSATNRAKSYALVPGKKFYSQRNDLQHGYYWDKTYEIYAFMEHILCGKATFIKIKSMAVNNGEVTLELENPEFIDGVKLLYSTSKLKDSHKWVWESRTVDFNGENSITVQLPDSTSVFTVEMTNKKLNPDFKMSSALTLIE